jgi:hypothetical protein
MPLTFDLSMIRDSGGVVDAEGSVMPWTETMIFWTMQVGINDITVKNFKKFELRVRCLYMATEDHKSLPSDISQLVARHIGLRTNASPMSDAKFSKLISSTLMERARLDSEQQERATELMSRSVKDGRRK